MISRSLSVQDHKAKEFAEELYGVRSHHYKSKKAHVKTIMAKHPEFFDPIKARFPKFDVMMARLLVNTLGFNVMRVDPAIKLADFSDKHVDRIARSVATLLRKRKTPEHAHDACRKQYSQMNVLYSEVEGFGSLCTSSPQNSYGTACTGWCYV